MHCDYFAVGDCRSCTLMGIPYAAQLADLSAHLRGVLADVVPESAWEPVVHGPESGFRNKAKLVVGGRRGEPTLGILDAAGRGVDLRHCGLHEPGLAAAVPALADWVAALGLTPYAVPTRTGELKHLVVTHSPDAEFMVRVVLRSPGQQRRVEAGLDQLRARVPGTRVVTVNLLPEHKAVVEGDVETVLTARQTLPMRVADLTLLLRPRSFFQTNTVVAGHLYAAARTWVADLHPGTVLDLYCGVGGFALACAAPDRQVVGVERSADAVLSARLAAGLLARRRPIAGATFHVGDAAAYPLDDRPDLVVVNPPRRGIGPDLADRLEAAAVPHLLYSSCNVQTLAADLRRMPSLRVVRAQPFDMFPQTRHAEVLVLAARR